LAMVWEFWIWNWAFAVIVRRRIKAALRMGVRIMHWVRGGHTPGAEARISLGRQRGPSLKAWLT
jgi:hypothetical protein